MNLFDLSQDVAVVIGGTGVLGGAIASGLAKAGAMVAVLGRNQERGEERARQIRDAAGKSVFINCDAQNKDSLRKAHQEVEQAFGAPTVLVNAAGGNDPRATVTPDQPIEAIATEAWKAVFDNNLIAGALLPCQEFGPAMAKRKLGSIINIASVSAHVPLSRVAAYASAKAALLNLSQFLAREWATANVRVNTITPGFFPAEQNKRLLFNDDGTPTARGKSILGHTPMARFGEAQELLGAVIYLASAKASSFVTGSDLVVDGGFLAQTI
jgi:NAD(P)-dependent dehydrogenase (short-subunit alcohol dehydrogenase family)